MMKARIIALLLALVAVVAVAGESHILKEEIKGAPLGWTKLERADPSQPIDLTILVKQQNVDQLIDIFERVSNPKLSDYGQYLTNEEVNELVAPKEQHIAAVMQWLHYNKIKTSESIAMTPNRDMIHISMTVGEAESLLQTHYHEYSHASGLTQVVRAERYSIPAYLVDAIDVIGPTVRFPSQSTVLHSKKREIVSAPMHTLKAAKVKKMKKSNPIQDACSQGTTPDCLKQLYSVNGYTATSPNTSLATTGYLEQYISPSDLAQFFESYDPTHARTATIIGPNDPTNPGVEASLDIQYTMGVAQGVPTQFWYTAGRQPLNPDNEPFLVFLLNLSSTTDAPWVISTSYGDDEHTVDYSYAVRVNQEFAKAAVRGISILFSSGDGGVSGGQSQPCTTFIPTYPAGSPFVTSVGGTTGFNPESGVYFSSGGFSNYWSRADMAKYQLEAVEDYFTTYSKNMPPPNLYNSSGRGFPDVSAQGTSYPVVVGGSMQPVDGTSCSTPTFSAIVSLLNDIRFAAGKPPLGFLNNLFYQNPQMFTDITTGSNPGCNTNGFTASQGWDPITGLGTPNFAAMANVVKNLP